MTKLALLLTVLLAGISQASGSKQPFSDEPSPAFEGHFTRTGFTGKSSYGPTAADFEMDCPSEIDVKFESKDLVLVRRANQVNNCNSNVCDKGFQIWSFDRNESGKTPIDVEGDKIGSANAKIVFSKLILYYKQWASLAFIPVSKEEYSLVLSEDLKTLTYNRTDRGIGAERYSCSYTK